MLLWPFLDGGCVCSRLLIYHCEPGDGDQLLWGLSSFAVLWPESSWLVCLCVVLLIFQSLTKGRVKCCKSTLETITEHDKLFLIPLRSIRGLELSTSDVYQKFDVSHIYSMKVKDVCIYTRLTCFRLWVCTHHDETPDLRRSSQTYLGVFLGEIIS